MAGVASFESVVDEYDAARPTYPDAVFDALGPLDGLDVVDVGAGTGIAKAWHWLDEASRVDEVHRVLRSRGRWAGWWSHARADGERWFDRYWAAIERSCPGTHRGQRDIDWGATIAAPGRFEVGNRVTVPWVREISVDSWMTDQASHSYVIGLPEEPRAELLAELRVILEEQFPDGAMSVRYETWLWIATRR
jgi:hypothetical protein